MWWANALTGGATMGCKNEDSPGLNLVLLIWPECWVLPPAVLIKRIKKLIFGFMFQLRCLLKTQKVKPRSSSCIFGGQSSHPVPGGCYWLWERSEWQIVIWAEITEVAASALGIAGWAPNLSCRAGQVISEVASGSMLPPTQWTNAFKERSTKILLLYSSRLSGICT